jgi:DNA-binding Lrp family transcriptional regulator
LFVEVIELVVEAYVLYKVGSGSEREVAQKISNFEEVMVASIVYGEYDVVAKVCVKDMQALDRFLSEEMRNVPGVVLTSTMIIAREYMGKKYRSAE